MPLDSTVMVCWPADRGTVPSMAQFPIIWVIPAVLAMISRLKRPFRGSAPSIWTAISTAENPVDVVLVVKAPPFALISTTLFDGTVTVWVSAGRTANADVGATVRPPVP